MPVTVLMTARPRAAGHRSDAYQGDSEHKGKFFTADMNKRSNECYVFLQKTQFLFDPKGKFSLRYKLVLICFRLVHLIRALDAIQKKTEVIASHHSQGQL